MSIKNLLFRRKRKKEYNYNKNLKIFTLIYNSCFTFFKSKILFMKSLTFQIQRVKWVHIIFNSVINVDVIIPVWLRAVLLTLVSRCFVVKNVENVLLQTAVQLTFLTQISINGMKSIDLSKFGECLEIKSFVMLDGSKSYNELIESVICARVL